MMAFASILHKVWTSWWFRTLLALAIAFFIYAEAHEGRNDLDIFLAASVDLFKGVDIYTATYFDGYHYYYSVLFASVIRPLADLPIWCAKAFWIVINVVMLFRIWRICLRFLPAPWLKMEMKTLFGFFLLIFCLRFIRGNLHLCQMTILMLYLSVESMNQVRNQKPWIAGVLLAFAINIKLLPIVLLPYLIYRAHWKASISAILVVLVLYMAPMLWMGKTQNDFLLSSWWHLVNPTQQKHVLDIEESSFHGLTTLFSILFVEDTKELNGLPNTRHVTNVSLETLHWIIQIVRLILIAGTLWFLRTRPFVSSRSTYHTWWEVSYLLLLVPLIFPHQQHYAFLMAMPAVAWIIYWNIAEIRLGRFHWLILSFVFLIYLAFNLSLLLGTYTAIYNHYKILTYGALLLIPVLGFTRPLKASYEAIV
jgi:hypothetical protein